MMTRDFAWVACNSFTPIHTNDSRNYFTIERLQPVNDVQNWLFLSQCSRCFMDFSFVWFMIGPAAGIWGVSKYLSYYEAVIRRTTLFKLNENRIRKDIRIYLYDRISIRLHTLWFFLQSVAWWRNLARNLVPLPMTSWRPYSYQVKNNYFIKGNSEQNSRQWGMWYKRPLGYINSHIIMSATYNHNCLCRPTVGH